MSTASSSSKPSKGWQPPTLEEMQSMLTQYEFISLLGRGGMGAVYKAQQVSLQRSVAIKVLPGDLIDDLEANFAERFKNEARTMAKMNHPGIVKVYDFGETQTGLFYIVMEFIDGTDVSQMIRAKGKLPQDYALAITAHVGDALAYAHKNGVIHRDIKPANILINQEGTVKVADFGLAKMNDSSQRGLTKTNTAMGTPDFVAPEALSPGTVVDGRADLYAMGVMLYQMLTGEIPRGMWSMPSTKVGTDPRFDAVILKSMQTDRELRYQDATEIRRDLDVIMTQPFVKEQPKPAATPAQQPVASKPSGGQPQSGPRASRSMPQGQAQTPARPVKKKSNDALIYLVAVVVIGVLVGLFWLSQSGNKPVELATIAPATPSSIPTTQPADFGPWTDLIPLIQTPLLVAGDTTRTQKGIWTLEGGVLSVKNAGPHEAISIPADIPQSYDLSLRMQTEGVGISHAGLIFIVAEKMLKLNSIQKTGGPTGMTVISKIAREGASPEHYFFTPSFLQPGKEHLVEISVRQEKANASIVVKAEGQMLFEWSGPKTNLTNNYQHGGLRPQKLAFTASMNANASWRDLRLRTVTGSSAAPLPPKPLPPQEPAPTAPTAAPALAAPLTGGAWRPVFTEAVKKSSGVTELPDGWMRVEKTYLPAPSGKDMAIRARMRFTGGTYVWPIRFRDTPTNGLMHYGLSITSDGKFLLFRRVLNSSKSTSDEKSLMEVKAPRPFAEGTEFDLEVSAQGDRLQVNLDGATIIDVRDTFHQGVRTQFGGDTAVVEFKNLEWRSLSPESVKSSTPTTAASSRPSSTPAAGSNTSMSLGERQKSLAAPLASGVMDVLTNISLKSNDTYLWTKTATGVELKSLKDPGPYKGCQNFPVVADPDYVIEAWFTNSVEGGADVGLTIPVGDQRRTTCWFWLGDGGWAGFGKVDGIDPQQPTIEPGCSTSFQLIPGELTFVRTEVRRSSDKVDLRFMVNGRLMGAYRGPTSRLNMSGAWIVGRDPEMASIGGRAVTFHRVTVQKLDLETEKKQAVLAALLTADPRIAKLEAGFKAAYETKAQKPYIAAVAALNQSYITNGIARAQTQANGKGDEVAALNAEKDAVEKGAGIPAEDASDVPELLKILRSTYRTALAKLEADRTKAAAPLYDIYVKALDAYIIELTRADKIQQAQDVQAFREKIATKGDNPISLPATSSPKTDVAPPSKDGFTNTLGMKFVPVSGTKVFFCIHETRRQDYAAYAAALPGVDGSWKNQQKNGIPCGDKDDHPVVGINGDDAKAFCAWLSKKEGKTYRLPTDEEWSFAVGLGQRERRTKDTTPEMLSGKETTEFPWEGDFPLQTKDQAGNYSDSAWHEKFPALRWIEDYTDQFATTAPVMSFKPNKLGLYDMGGNVWEWVEDDKSAAQTGQVARGASFANFERYTLLSSYRAQPSQSLRIDDYGFRCVMEKP